ncbi:MAG: ankyrin repeat domain-containing protein [Vulcanimicrobiota bacterium]
MKLKLIQLMVISAVVMFFVLHWCVKILSDNGQGNENLGNTGMHREGSRRHIRSMLQRDCSPWFEYLTFFKAVYREDTDRVNLFLRAGVNPSLPEEYCWSEQGHERWTALHIAAFKGNVRFIAMFLEMGVPVDAIDSYGMTALHWAAFSGNKKWVDRPIAVSFWHYEQNEPFGLFIGHYPNFESEYLENRDTSVPATESIRHREISALLLQRGAQIHAKDTFGQTPLHIAAYVGNATLVELLLKKDAHTGSVDKNGRNPLHLAAWGNHLKVVEMLLAAGASADHRDSAGFTPLHLAVTKREDTSNAVRALISHGADVNARERSGETPLFYARNIGTVKTLIASGADVKIMDREYRTVLHRLVSGNRLPYDLKQMQPIAEFWDLATEDRYKLYKHKWRLFSTDDQEENVMDLLLHKGAGINDRDSRGASALNYAVRFNSGSSVKALIERGADVNIRDNEQKTIFHCMAERWNNISSKTLIWNDTIDILIKKRVDINARDVNGATPLDYAIWNGDSELIGLFKGKGGKPSLALPAAAENVAKSGNRKKLRKLLDNNPELIRSRGFGGSTLLHIAAEEGHLDCCSVIIDQGGEVNGRNSYLETPLMRAVIKDRIPVAQLLIDNGADINCRNYDGGSPIGRATGSDNVKMLESLISRVKLNDINTALTSSYYGSTRLHSLAEQGHDRAAALLLRKGINVNIRDDEGRTPLFNAASCGNYGRVDKSEMIKLLISYGADVNARDNLGKTPLYEACEQGSESYGTVNFLISKGADVNLCDYDGYAPLHVARSARIADLLIRKGADVNALTTEGQSPLHFATNDECTRLLIASGADVNARNKSCETPLFNAVSKGLDKGTLIILSKGADADAMNRYGETPLFYAVRESHDEAARLLLSKGADVDAINPFGSTPLMEAVKENDEIMADLLVSHGADVNARDMLGRTPLMLAEKWELVNRERAACLKFISDGKESCDINSVELLKASGAVE